MWGCELRSLPTGVNNNWRALELCRDLHQAAGRDFDVGRADVAVDNPRLISVGQALGYLPGEAQRPLNLEHPLPLQDSRQCPALHVFQDDESEALFSAVIQDLDRMR